jgi:hypothetical protein
MCSIHSQKLPVEFSVLWLWRVFQSIMRHGSDDFTPVEGRNHGHIPVGVKKAQQVSNLPGSAGAIIGIILGLGAVIVFAFAGYYFSKFWTGEAGHRRFDGPYVLTANSEGIKGHNDFVT